jgi:hypothetical protein
MSGKLVGANLLDISTGDAGGWGISLDTLKMNIEDNVLKYPITTIGKVNIDVIGTSIDYNGNLFKDINNYFAFDLFPFGGLEMPFLKTTATFDDQSTVYIRKELDLTTNKWVFRPYADFNITSSMNLPESLFINAGLEPVIESVKTGLGLLGYNIETFNFGISDVKLNSLKINHPDLPEGKMFGLASIDGGEVTVPGYEFPLTDLALLEIDIPGIPTDQPQLPGLGFNAKIAIGGFNFEAGVWAKKTINELEKPNYAFEKVILQLPKLPSIPVVDFKCVCEATPYCNPPFPANFSNLPSATPDVGDIVQVGHFEMEITSLNGTGGEGELKIPFLGKALNVEWVSNITFANDNGTIRLRTGNVVSKATQLIPSNLATNMVADATDAVPIDLSSLAIDDFMDEMTGYMSSMSDLFSLPFSLKEVLGTKLPADFDFMLMGIRFDKEKANVSSMITFKLPGDGPYLKFGLAGLRIRPDGVNLDGVEIYLAEDIKIGF